MPGQNWGAGDISYVNKAHYFQVCKGGANTELFTLGNYIVSKDFKYETW